jgi:hypothetical protein
VNEQAEKTLVALLEYATDIYVALKGIADELDAWSKLPVSGYITVGTEQITRMATETATPIPADDCPATVDWQDKLGTSIEHAKTDTTWSAEDESGAASQAVTVNPDLDSDSDDETATVVFSASQGMFKVVATTPGATGTIRAESILYEIQAGAPAVGTITLSPA